MDLFDLFAKISIDLSDFDQGIDKAQKKFKSFSDNISGLSGKIDNAYKGVGDLLSPAVDGFKAVEGVGKKAGNAISTGLKGFAAASTAVAGFGTAAVNSGMKFDATMSEVSAISGKVADEDLPDIIKKAQEMGISFKDTGDATSTVMDILRNKALQMGASTKFSASEAGEAMTYMAMAGWKAGDMIGGIEGIMNLAAASGEDLATTSDIVTDALTAFGMQASDSGHFADILAAASSNANTNVGMMGETFKYAAPLAGAMGYTAEDTALAIGLMANSGIKASQAGTSLRSIMTRLAKPTKESSTAMEALGISITNSDGSMKPFGTTISELRTAFSGLSEEQKASYAAMLGGQEAMSGLLAIVNAAPADVEKLTSAIYDCNGAAKEMAATMVDNLQGDLTLLGSAFESLQIAISDSLTPTLREFAQFGQKAMANLLEGFQGGGVSGFMSALSGIVTDGVTMLAAKAPEFASVSLQFVGALAQGLIDAAPQVFNSIDQIRGALITGLRSFLDKNSDDLVGIGNGILNQIMMGFRSGVSVISDYIGDFVPLIIRAFTAYHKEFFTAGMEILGSIGKGIFENKTLIQENMSQAVFEMALALKDNAPMIIEGGIALLEALVGAIEENLPLILETGAVIIGKLIEGITTASPGVQAIIATAVLPHILKIIEVAGTVGQALSGMSGLAVKAVSAIGSVAGTVIGAIITGLQALWAAMLANPFTAIIAIVGALVAALVVLWNTNEDFRNAVGAIWEAIKGFFVGAWEAIQAAWKGAGEFFAGVVDGIKGVFEGIGEFLGGLFQAAWELVRGSWDVAVGFFTEIGNGIQAVFEAVASFLGEAFSAAWSAITAVWDAAVGFFSAIWNSISSAGQAAAEAIGGALKGAWDAITGVWSGAVSFFGGIASSIIGVFSDIGGKFLSIGSNIVDGLKNGIANAWNSFIGWLNDKVGGIVNGVKSMLGIHSPSTVFAGIGENMALGLAEGWGDQYSSIKRQIENGMNFGTATVGLNVSGRSGGGAYGNSGGQTVNQGGDTFIFNSPKALDPVSAAREMKKAKQKMALGYV